MLYGERLESGSGLIYIVIALVVGGAAGYFFSRFRNRHDDRDAKLAKLQSEYDEYRANVRNHFIDTVSAISRIDEQQKQLHQSIAAGVTELCVPATGDDDYFLEQTIQTLGQLESSKKDREDKLDFD